MQKLLLALSLLLTTTCFAAEPAPQAGNTIPQQVAGKLRILEERAQKIPPLAQRGSAACDKAYNAIGDAGVELGTFSSAVENVGGQEWQLRGEIDATKELAKETPQWRGAVERAGQQIIDSEREATQIAQQVCSMAEGQILDDQELAQIENLANQMTAAQGRANQAYGTLQAVGQQVNAAWMEVALMRSKVAQVNVQIDRVRSAQGQVDLVVRRLQMQRGLAGDDMSEVMRLVDSSPALYRSAIDLIDRFPDGIDPSSRARLDKAMNQIKAAGFEYGGCTDEVQEKFGAFDKRYNAEKEKFQSIQERNRRNAELVTTVPGSIQGLGVLQEQLANSMPIFDEQMRAINLYAERVETCRANAEGWGEEWDEAMKGISEALQGVSETLK
jgi:hypothetical protein